MERRLHVMCMNANNTYHEVTTMLTLRRILFGAFAVAAFITLANIAMGILNAVASDIHSIINGG